MGAQQHTWILHSWLSDLFFAVSFDVAGYRGIVALHALLLMLVGAVVVVGTLRFSDTLPGLIVGFACIGSLIPYSGERPQLFSFALTGILALVILRALQDDRAPWLCVPLSWLWANLHGLWPLVALTLFATAVGLRVVGRRELLGRFTAAGALAALVPLLGPLGVDVYLAPLNVWRVHDLVTEWATPAWETPWSPIILALAVTGALGAIHARSLAPYAAMLALVGCLAVFSTRFLPVEAILAAPVSAAWLQGRRGVPPAVSQLRTATGLVAALLVAASAFLVTPVPVDHPDGPLRALRSLPPGTRVLTTPERGNMLLWSAPLLVPGIDGRYEVYGHAYVANYLEALGQPTRIAAYAHSGAYGAAWLAEGSRAVRALQAAGWMLVLTDADSHSVVLAREGVV